MARPDAEAVGRRAVGVGLLKPEQLHTGFDEVGGPGGDPEEFLRAMERKGHLTPWQSQKLLKGEAGGYFLGGYRILYKIASGTFGRVYRADDPSSGKIVAIKVLRARWSENARNIDSFEREGKVGMTMQHPNIVEILSVNCDHKNRQYYIVMEFVEGGNLRDFLKIRKKLPALDALRILEDASDGLAYAWSQGISHRDLKLTNVLISSQGPAKLVDFGLAGLSQHLHKEESTDVDRTVEYAGLEKSTGVAQGDIRSDIYFLGCIGYELLTGMAPLAKSRSQYERMRKTRFEKVKPLTAANVDAPPSVFRLVEKMMALQPSHRFQTPSQLLDAIRVTRQELEGQETEGQEVKTSIRVGDGKSIFVLEKDIALQDSLRNGFKKLGFRVFMSSEPSRALDRFRQDPFDAILVDAGTVGEDGIFYFDRILKEAESDERICAGVMILSKHQHGWRERVTAGENAEMMVRPVSMKQLQRQLIKLMRKLEQSRSD